jgi:TrkA-C domain
LEDAFLVGLKVLADSPATGRTVAEAGLRGLDGLYLTSVKRGDQVIHAVGPDFLVLAKDILFFAGDLPKVTQIAQRFKLRTVTDAFEEDLPALVGSPTAVRAHQRTVFMRDGSESVRFNLSSPSLTVWKTCCSGN